MFVELVGLIEESGKDNVPVVDMSSVENGA
jgi:hypothetical protein